MKFQDSFPCFVLIRMASFLCLPFLIVILLVLSPFAIMLELWNEWEKGRTK